MTVTAPAVTPVTDRAAPPVGLAERGRRLWRDLIVEGKPTPGQLVLIEEACRIADRLDRLDAVLTGDADCWMRFRERNDGTEVTVTVDQVLAEARQQAAVLKGIVAELRQGGSRKPTGQEGSIVDQLAARRAARLAGAAGS